MKDLGFGLVDQRTVVIVLVTATLCGLLGLTFPLHTENILQAFLDLVLLTGYVYLARSIIRFPIAVWMTIRKLRRYGRRDLMYYFGVSETTYRIGKKELDLTRSLFVFAGLADQRIWKGFLGFVDRVGVIALTVVITLPTTGQSLMVTGGGVGLGLMICIYLIGGSFSFLVEDALKRAADEHAAEQEELVKAASTQPEFPRAIETYTVDHRYDNIGG